MRGVSGRAPNFDCNWGDGALSFTLSDVEYLFFFFSSRRRHTRSDRDWSSDVCSSDLLETIERLWAVDSDVQIVICSAYSQSDWRELLSRIGHSDQLIILKKPFEPVEILQCASALSRKWQNERVLRRHVEGLEQVVTARTQGLEAANRQLRYLATHDVLTGLPNRAILDDRLEQASAHADRDIHEFALLLLDLDRFKLINDSLGHRAGDELLKEVARRLKSVVRTADTL